MTVPLQPLNTYFATKTSDSGIDTFLAEGEGSRRGAASGSTAPGARELFRPAGHLDHQCFGILAPARSPVGP